MKKDRFKLNTVVNAVIEKDNKVLLMKRSDGFFKGGYWVLPAGHVDGGETARKAMARELKEELSIIVDEKDIEFAQVMHSITPYLERVDFFFYIKNYLGEINNIEELKCEELKYFDYNNLPNAAETDSTTIKFLEAKKKGQFYSEKGFEKGYTGFSDLDKFSFEALYNEIEKRSLTSKIHKENLIEKMQDLNTPTLDSVGNIIEAVFLYAQNNGLDIKEVIYNKFKNKKV